MTKKRLLTIAVAGALGLLTVPSPGASAQPPTTCLGDDVNDNRATDAEDFLTGSGDRDVIALGDGGDQYFSAGGADTLCGNAGADVLGGEDGGDRLSGGPDNDIVAGLAGADGVNGNAGSDTVSGGAGDDTLRGGDDADPDDIYDGPGNDTVIGTDVDTWYQCSDGVPDNHDAFTGKTLPDPDC